MDYITLKDQTQTMTSTAKTNQGNVFSGLKPRDLREFQSRIEERRLLSPVSDEVRDGATIPMQSEMVTPLRLTRLQSNSLNLLTLTGEMLYTQLVYSPGKPVASSDYKTEIMPFLCLAKICMIATVLGIEVVADPGKAWGEKQNPSLELVAAKLVRYASNIMAVSHAYPETTFDSGLDHDVNHYVIFLDRFCNMQGLDPLKLIQMYGDSRK